MLCVTEKPPCLRQFHSALKRNPPGQWKWLPAGAVLSLLLGRVELGLLSLEELGEVASPRTGCRHRSGGRGHGGALVLFLLASGSVVLFWKEEAATEAGRVQLVIAALRPGRRRESGGQGHWSSISCRREEHIQDKGSLSSSSPTTSSLSSLTLSSGVL